MKKVFLLFLLLFSFTTFAGQDGNGSDGKKLSEVEKKFCESIGIFVFDLDDVSVDMTAGGQRSILNKEDIIAKCCKYQPNAPACIGRK